MKDLLFAIFDVKMKLFMSPFCGRNVDSALRQFSDLCNNPNSQLSRHPEDFVLYEIGSFDVEYGRVEPLGAVHVVGKALDYVKAADKQEVR